MRSSALALLFGVIVACAASSACGAGQSIPADAQRTVISLTKIDCADCGQAIVEDLRKRPGVYDASFDKRAAEIRVFASPSFDVFTAVRQLAAVEGFGAVVGAGKGNYIEWAKQPEGADVKLVAKDGEDVPDLKAVLAAGKITIVDFSAIWCEPCRKLDEHVVKLLETRKDIAYRKLDIGDWDTPLAQRYLKKVPALPYVIVFGPEGARVEEIAGLNIPRFDAAIASATKP